ncbi:MAG: arginase family protein [Frankia sp.]
MVNVVVLGVATSAGAHHAGQDRAPDALRGAGLLDRLGAAGVSVVDRGDVSVAPFAVDHDHPTRRNLDAVVRVARDVADAVADVVAGGGVPLVLGGDCTITLGVVAGVQRSLPDVGLFYFDGDADLATPATTSSGVLDAMGVAHLLGLADSDLARLGATTPMLADERLVLVGYNEGDPETFREQVLRERPRLARFPDRAVRADPTGTAKAALSGPRTASDGLIVHFDVDAVDSGDLPLGNFPHYGTGVTLDQAGLVLTVAAAAPGLAAVVLTEVNPSYDPTGHQLERYVETVAAALGAGLGEARATGGEPHRPGPSTG